MRKSKVTAVSLATALSPLWGIAAWLAGPLPAPADEVPFTEIELSAPAGPRDVYAADLDGDGDIDILFASSVPGNHKIGWYQSNGGLPVTFTGEIVISTTALDVTSVFAADVDGDGNTDVLSASPGDHKIAWYKNDGALFPPTFTEQVISTNALGARSVFAADLDGDGDIDVLSASDIDSKLAWYENDGESPPSFTERVIATDIIPFGPRSLFATDLDGDGDIDVLTASLGTAAAPGTAWYENDGESSPNFTKRVITSTRAISVYAADMDRDGHIDILSGSNSLGGIKWHENDGDSPPTFTEHPIAPNNDYIPTSMFTMDMDLDGDTDVLVATLSAHFVWYDSSGGFPPTFIERDLVSHASTDESAFGADLDGDGDIDVLWAGKVFTERFAKIKMYINLLPRTAGDMDRDGDVDLQDYALFQEVFTGPF
ncbi:MAG: VCBS repeat-containing protein [Planctomycetes bacterium]|nr:VCBS repeat-containing protein [Planctomycetota bacterium]